MAALRDPNTGCPWDVEQDFASIAPYTIEEAYEVADAIDRGDLIDLKDELGDLLLQVVFHARMAQEQGASSSATWSPPICDKMMRRHPHVFPHGCKCRGRQDAGAAADEARGMPTPTAALGRAQARRTRGTRRRRRFRAGRASRAACPNGSAR